MIKLLFLFWYLSISLDTWNNNVGGKYWDLSFVG